MFVFIHDAKNLLTGAIGALFHWILLQFAQTYWFIYDDVGRQVYFLAHYTLPRFLCLCHELPQDGGRTQVIIVLGHILANVQAVCYRIFSNLIRTSFCRFLKRKKKKLVRGANRHRSFNRP
jgi:hypothetical protein